MTTIAEALFEADRRLTAPGAPFELAPRSPGDPVRAFKNRRPNVRQLLIDALPVERDCVVFDDGRRYTFAAFGRAVSACAAQLRDEFGIGKGDRVAIAGANSLEWLVAFWACQSLGAVAAGMNAWWTASELDNALRLVEPKLVLADEQRVARIDASPAPVRRLDRDLVVDPDSTCPLPDVEIDERDDALLLFTSGTTGRPKAAVLTHGNIVGFSALNTYIGARGAMLAGITSAGGAPPARLGVFPMFHVSGVLGSSVSGMASATTTVWALGRFDPAKVIELTETENIAVWGGSHTHIARLLDAPELRDFDGSLLRQVGVGGSASSPALIRRVEERFPHLVGTFSSGYGSSEVGGLVSFAPNALLREAVDCVGPPLPGVDVRILDDDGAVLPDGEEGNICVRSALVMREYWRNPEANRDAFVDGVWLRTGDYGRLEGGLLHIAARRRDLILRGGENVYPFEIENRLEAHPAVHEAAAYGVDDDTYGQVVHAVVVVRPGAVAHEEQLRVHCREVLSGYKVPDRIHLRVEPLPRNPSGKVMKHVLVQGVASGFDEH